MLQKKKEKKENSWSKIGRKQKKKKVPGQRSKESKRKRKFPIEIRRKQKKIYRKVFGPDNVWINIQDCHKQERKERKPWLVTHEVVPFLITNQNLLCRWLFRPTLSKNRKGKGQNTQSKVSPPKIVSRTSPIDPWFPINIAGRYFISYICKSALSYFVFKVFSFLFFFTKVFYFFLLLTYVTRMIVKYLMIFFFWWFFFISWKIRLIFLMRFT